MHASTRVEDAPAAPTAPRQLVLLCDGTNNNLTGGHRDTNVVKLGELLVAHGHQDRLVHYDPGVGNPGELPGATLWDGFRRRLDRVYGLAFGRGVYENMLETYLFLMRHHRPGDELYLFGFSRGAFTARSVAGLVNQFGILQPHMEGMLPTLLHVYFADRRNQDAYRAITDQIKRQFTDQASRAVDIHFVGVWDTVAAVGLPPFDTRFTALPTVAGKRFVHVRQALALDEHRRPFRPRAYAGENGVFKTASGLDGTLQQRWFPGAHGDVGGGYEPVHSALSDTALAWVVSEAVGCGLRLAATGRPLDTEAGVLEALHALPAGHRDARAPRRHSELSDVALWALAGMEVRDPGQVVMDGGAAMTITPVAHPAADDLRKSLQRQDAAQPARIPWLVWLAMVVGLLAFAGAGQLLHGVPGTGSVIGDALAAFRSLADYATAAADFQVWQLTGWWQGSMADRYHLAFGRFESPRAALVWDLGLIASLAVVLSWFCARAFHRIAGLRRVDDPPRVWLNRLGIALPLAVSADLAENVFTWVALTLGRADVEVLASGAHLLAAACSVLKWVGLTGALALVLWGIRPAAGARH